MWSASDEALIAGMAAGDEEAVLVFVRRFQSRVFGLALTITRDRSAAEEVAQDAFLRAWRYGASYDPRRGTATAWLLGIVRNAAIARLSRDGRRRSLVPADSLEVVAELSVDDDAANRHAELALVVDGLRSLPPEQRDAFVGATYFGFTAHEMSEAWDIPLGTVKTRLRAAVHKLRDSLTGVER